jgi:hypothetical protein
MKRGEAGQSFGVATLLSRAEWPESSSSRPYHFFSSVS